MAVLRAAALLALLPGFSALAQDVRGVELCTSEKQMDRRTSCLQSNVEFLQQKINRNALDAQHKLAAAHKEIAALKEALAKMQTSLDELKKAKPAGK
jgi:septal ring factor EnvC (AmiA/AmiB activator)